MSIRKKIIGIILTAAIGIAILIGAVYYSYNKLEQMNEEMGRIQHAVLLGRDILISANQARVKELEFSKVFDESIVAEAKQEIANLRKHAEELKVLFGQESITKSSDMIIQYSTMFERRFEEQVANQKEVGYTPNSGLRKELNTISSKFESLLQEKSDNQALQIFRNLRLIEKDFISDNIPINEFFDSLELLEKYIEESNRYTGKEKEVLHNTLTSYTSVFSSIQQLVIKNLSSTETFNSIITTLNEEVQKINKELDGASNAIAQEKEQMMKMIVITVLIVSISVLALLLLIGIFVLRSISTSIDQLQTGAKVIGDGNLAHRVREASKDEMGKVAANFNHMAERVQRSLIEVKQVAYQLSSSSETLYAVSEQTTAQGQEVSSAIEQVVVGAQKQSEDLEFGSSLIDGMIDHINDITERTERISQQAKTTTEKGQLSIEVMNELDKTSKEYVELAQTLIQSVLEIAEQSNQILSVLKSIEEISDNTGLLALNASIEAARAGEAGKGFAVVANEVGKLAEKTKSETNHIQQVISGINKKITKSTEEAQKMEIYNSKQQETVTQTLTSFYEIVEQVTQIEESSEEICKALEDTTSSSKQLLTAMHDISAVSEEATASSEELSASNESQMKAINEVNTSASNLQELSKLLLEEVNKFKLES